MKCLNHPGSRVTKMGCLECLEGIAKKDSLTYPSCKLIILDMRDKSYKIQILINKESSNGDKKAVA